MSNEISNIPRSSGRIVWRSLESKANPVAEREDAKGSDVVKQHISSDDLLRLNRRKFLTLSGAVGALASIEGCIRRPEELILPYSQAPEFVNPGVPSHYASVMDRRGEALGLLVTSHEGRPTKIEGNPEHPSSLGGTDIWAQATVLDLYDPDRARTPSEKGEARTFAQADAWLSTALETQRAKGGAGLRVLSPPSCSPTFIRVREEAQRRFPAARFYTYTPVNETNVREGARLAFGQPVANVPNLGAAKVVLSLDCDFMLTEQGSALTARQFAAGRELNSSQDGMNRLYAVEPTLSVTGSNADHRLRLPAQDIARYALALAAELAAAQNVPMGSVADVARGVSVPGVSESWIKAVAKDLASHRGECLVMAGARQPAAVHALVYAMNHSLGNAGKTISYRGVVDAAEADQLADIKALADDIAQNKVELLLVLDGNPAYDAPADLGFAEIIAKVPASLHLSHYVDETSAKCAWQVPLAHFLETWGDQQSLSGFYSVQQPLIAPLWGGRSPAELLAVVAGEANWRAYNVVRATAHVRGAATEQGWRTLLHKGVSDSSVPMLAGLPVRDAAVSTAIRQLAVPATLGAENLEVVFLTDNKMLDGRYNNNTWLLEMPDPLTRIVWDNVALFAPSTAKELGIENGDMIKLSKDGASIEIAAWKLPGQAAYSIGLPLGWGRTATGPKNGKGTGFNVYPLRTVGAPNFVGGVKVEKLGRKYTVSQTQDHDSMENRPLAIEASLDEYRERPNFPAYESPDPSVPPLWKTQDYSKGLQWGMVVDLNMCNGCNACVIACQSENNVSVVGKDQVARGREMHWFRIDRYFVGENEDQPDVSFQPIGCQHCEEAPCENVCPVNATSHSPEGLNDIAYNRCIGTRYCMNNCPYKVRRFNYFNFNLDIPETRRMQYNPNVSLRFRGVVEKCSYCVQRVEFGKIRLRAEGRETLKDGDVRSACQQACPANAIAFGDLNDPNSRVAQKRKVDRNYALLAEIGTRPRTRFLGKLRNPNPEMKG